MKTVSAQIENLLYIQLPEDQGQPSQTAWAYDPSSERLIRRSFAWDTIGGRLTNLRHEYRSYAEGRRGEFDPINGKLNAIGKGRSVGFKPSA